MRYIGDEISNDEIWEPKIILGKNKFFNRLRLWISSHKI